MIFLNQTGQIFKTPVDLSGDFSIVFEKEDRFYLSIFNNKLGRKNIIFNKYFLGQNLSYQQEICNFYHSEGLQEKDIRFKFSDFTYITGARLNNNKFFSQKLVYFAPLFVYDLKFPRYFVLFKLKSPVFISSNLQYEDNFNKVLAFIKEAEIIKIFDLKNFSDYIKKSYRDFNFSYFYEFKDKDNRPNIITLYGIDFHYGTLVQKDIFFKDGFQNLNNNSLSEVYRNSGLISHLIFNLEFLFDDDINVSDINQLDYHYHYHYHYHSLENNYLNYYYGIYIDLEEYDKLSIDIDKFNSKLTYKINNEYTELPNSDDFIIKSDYENYPYNDFFLKEPSKKIQQINSFLSNNKKCIFLKDKNENYYNVSGYNEKLKSLVLNTKYLNLSYFFGLDTQQTKILSSNTLLNLKKYQHILLEFNKNSKELFIDGDYLSIKSDLLNKEWRIYASSLDCCSSNDVCQNFDTTTYKFKPSQYFIKTFPSDFISKLIHNCDYHYHSYHYHLSEFGEGSILLTFVINEIIPLRNYDMIKVFWSYCGIDNYKDFHIYNVQFNTNLKQTRFSILDFDGEYFRNYFLIQKFEFEYQPAEFDYTFFNISHKNTNAIVDEMVDAFNRFEDGLFLAKKINENQILILGLNENNYFHNFQLIVNYDFNPNLKLSFKINDLELKNLKVYAKNGTLLYNHNLAIIDFYGTTKSNYLDRFNHFYLEKSKANLITGLELIPTKISKFSRLKKWNYMDTNFYHTNYIYDDNKINKYYVYLIENDYDDIILANNNTLFVFYPFSPKLYESDFTKYPLLYLNFSPQVVQTDFKCSYNQFKEVLITNQFITIPRIDLNPYAIDKDKLEVYHFVNQFNIIKLKRDFDYFIREENIGNKKVVTSIKFKDDCPYLILNTKFLLCYDSVGSESEATIFQCNYNTLFEKTIDEIIRFYGPLIHLAPRYGINSAKFDVWHYYDNKYHKLRRNIDYRLEILVDAEAGERIHSVIIQSEYFSHYFKFNDNQKLIICYDS